MDNEKEYWEAYDEGFKWGQAKGRDEWYKLGYDDGFADGYEKAKRELEE